MDCSTLGCKVWQPAAGALAHPTSEDPAAKAPASIALAYSFKGLSAFLSKALLMIHLDSIESKENGKIDSRERGVCRAVDRVSDKSSHVHGGTGDQLADKDSLGGVQNAVQAAGRIQAAFRILFPLRKKRRWLFRTGIAAACLSVRQEQFRMGRVRAHQETKKYKELLSCVGVLEKVMIRWYQCNSTVGCSRGTNKQRIGGNTMRLYTSH